MVAMKIGMPENCVVCPMWEPSVYANCKVLKKRIPYHEGVKDRDPDCPLVEIRPVRAPMTDEELEGCGFEL